MDKSLARTFIELPIFSKRWHELGFDDDDLFDLQNMLLENPEVGDMMQGTGGIRKVRFAFEDNLSNSEKNELKKLVKILKDEVARKGR